MKPILLGIIYLFPLFVVAQVMPDISFMVAEDYFDKEQISKQYVLADKVNLRTGPSKNDKVVEQLHIGQEVVVLERSIAVEEINGIKSHWYKIKTSSQIGWLWGGLIAQVAFGSQTKAEVKFVFGLSKIVEEEEAKVFYYQIRAFKGKQELDRIVFRETNGLLYEIKTLGNQTLPLLDDIIVVDIPCESCGCTGGEAVTFWNGRSFSEITWVLETADAWASEGAVFIYPTAMKGEANYIIKETNEFIDKVDNRIHRKQIVEYYQWDGHQLVQDPTRKKKEKEYWIEE